MTHSKLQTKRLEAQMSQSQLAAAAGINGRMLQYYEQFITPPLFYILRRVSHELQGLSSTAMGGPPGH